MAEASIQDDRRTERLEPLSIVGVCSSNDWGKTREMCELDGCTPISCGEEILFAVCHSPFCPTELVPPVMTMGIPAYFPLASLVTGASKPSPRGTWLYSPTYAAVRTVGIVAASSKVILGGILSTSISNCQISEEIRPVYLRGVGCECDNVLLETPPMRFQMRLAESVCAC